jgi:hypothetical protein
MVRFPRGWPAFHPQAARRGTSTLAWIPGWRGTGARPIDATPIGRYQSKITGVPLTGGQVLATVPASGKLTLSVGPQGLGTVWYPVQVTLTTSTGQASALGDSSTANAYLGPAVSQNTAVGSVFGGNGVLALAIPDMTPGQTLLATWSGANPGDTAAINIIGTMDALSTG